MYSARCILGEFYIRRPIMQGESDIDQLHKIWQLCGTPTESTWPGWEDLPGCEGQKKFVVRERIVKQKFSECVFILFISRRAS